LSDPNSGGHVAVIGAGIVGVSAALWLARSGRTVTLIDRQAPGDATSFGNGGVLASSSIVPVTVPGLMKKAPGMLLNSGSPLFLRWSYLPRLMPWLLKYLSHANAAEATRISEALAPVVGDSLEEHQALAKGTAAEKWITPSNYLFVYKDRAAYEGDAFGWSLRKAAGMRWDELDETAFRSHDPLFGPECRFAVRLGDHGHIKDPGRYVKDLAGALEPLGGRLLEAEVTDFSFDGGRLTGLQTDQGPIACDEVVLAAGVWSKGLADRLGMSVPMETERGYHLELYEPSAMPADPVMVAAGKFVATPMEGRIRLAGIVEFGGLDAAPGEGPYKVLETEARKAMPGLTWKHTERWMGHRPAPSDSIPVIGPAPGRRDIFLAFGHHHVGLTAGPKTGRWIADLITGKTPNIDMTAYDPARFSAKRIA